mmetsp:Transcript_2805/g.7540  ORF Transcript_2805/g.7540 Transcript_2805/m.7540 type:complete len:127 (-) Transcript_2805:3469-3849(-)
MSLRCLALLGSKNEPLYVCAPDPVDGGGDDGEAAQQMEDAFGFFGASQPDTDTDTNPTTPGPIKRPASIRHEIMIHAAIDRIEELIGSHKKTSWKRFQRGSHWIGLICPMEEYDVSTMMCFDGSSS